MTRRRQEVTVDFKPTLVGTFRESTPLRFMGGVSIYSKPESYSGPKEFDLISRERVLVGEFPESISRRFRVLRVEDDPTGAAGGSFKIDEVLAGGKIIALGFNYSIPDYDVCVRIASMSGKNAYLRGERRYSTRSSAIHSSTVHSNGARAQRIKMS